MGRSARAAAGTRLQRSVNSKRPASSPATATTWEILGPRKVRSGFSLASSVFEDTSGPLVGDLYEEWQDGRSTGWFWRQTMRALHGRATRYVAARRPLAFLGLAAIGLYWVGT